jgi:hypothetical protein
MCRLGQGLWWADDIEFSLLDEEILTAELGICYWLVRTKLSWTAPQKHVAVALPSRVHPSWLAPARGKYEFGFVVSEAEDDDVVAAMVFSLSLIQLWGGFGGCP